MEMGERCCILTAIGVAVVTRWLCALSPHSGESKAPMFGDYEAQRHWMEITVNVPLVDWYNQTEDNVLQYWGLDYPPLTAYHSYVMGNIAEHINESWVSLHNSRGEQSYDHKFFMRSTVIVSDLMTYIPAAYIWVFKLQTSQSTSFISKCVLLCIHLLYPGYLLIDYAHFQYNCVSLGLCLAAVCAICMNHNLVASALFVMALNYKQMILYHSLPIFFYLLGHSIGPKHTTYFKKLTSLIKVGLVTICTFVLIWSPFILAGTDTIKQVFIRLFPLGRGIFEDKVANMWCALSVIVKLRQMPDQVALARISAGMVLLCSAPSCLMLLYKPTKRQLRHCLPVVSLIFFLMSFQVHEKSILLVAMPVLLLVDEYKMLCTSFLLSSSISLFPLCQKDETELAFFAVTVLYYIMLTDCLGLHKTESIANLIMFHCVHIGGLLACLASMLIPPPDRYPDVHALLNSLMCCLLFMAYLIQLYACQLVDFIQTCDVAQSKASSKKMKKQ